MNVDEIITKNKLLEEELQKTKDELHRPERKMRQNAVMTYIFYNYVSSNLLNFLS